MVPRRSSCSRTGKSLRPDLRGMGTASDSGWCESVPDAPVPMAGASGGPQTRGLRLAPSPLGEHTLVAADAGRQSPPDFLIQKEPMLRRTAFLVLIAGISAGAQAPKITQQGDPSVNRDTIYKLAVKAEDHPEEDAVYLLDDGVVRLEADGRGTMTVRQVIQILKQAAVENFAEWSFGYAPGHEKFTLNWLRVI